MGSLNAAIITIDDFTYDLDQFAGATVTTVGVEGAGASYLAGSYPADHGIESAILGALWTNPAEVGDHVITLGADDNTVDTLTFTYGTPLSLTASDKLVVFEIGTPGSGEPTNFTIAVNGGLAVSATTGTLTEQIGGTFVNRIVFDITSLTSDPIISSIVLQNENLGPGNGNDDPDFLFIGVGQPVTSQPEPGSLVIALVTLGGVALARRRRTRDE